MANHTGLSPNNPLKYLGPNVYLNTVVTRNREPTGADYRQPETGKLYPFNTFWLISKNPTTGIEGDLWYLSKIAANVGFWVKLSTSAAGPLLSLLVQAAFAPGVNPVTPDGAGQMVYDGALVTAVGIPIRTTTRALNEYNLEVQIASAVAGSDVTQNGLAHFNSIDFTIDANGFVTLAGSAAADSFTPDEDFDGSAATPILPQAGNINVFGSIPAVGRVTETYNSNGLSTGNLMVEHRAWLTPLVVDKSVTPGSRGTFSSITSANAVVVAGQTIFIRSTTTAYAESFTAVAGVSYVAFGGSEDIPTVSIQGKVSYASAGAINFSNINFIGSGDYFLEVTGAVASVVNLTNCNFSAANFDGMHVTSSSASTRINAFNCTWDIAPTFRPFVDTSPGDLLLFSNRGGNTTTHGTKSDGRLAIESSDLFFPIETSGGNQLGVVASNIDTGGNVVPVIAGGSKTQAIYNSRLDGGTSPALTCTGPLCVVYNNIIDSSNTNAIDGAGSITYGGLIFEGTSSHISTTTQIVKSEGPSRTIGGANSGLVNTLMVNNTSNTASSAANVLVQVAGATASDATYQAQVSGVTTWTWGVDNSDADAWVLAQGTALGTTNVMHVLTTGEINFPLQSAFLATANAQPNVTGDGTNYSVLFANEIFDQNNDFASSTYTCPVTSRVTLHAILEVSGLVVANTSGSWLIQTSNRNYIFSGLNWGVVMNVGTSARAAGSVLADMDTGDIANVICQVSGGAAVADVGATCSFSGNIEA